MNLNGVLVPEGVNSEVEEKKKKKKSRGIVEVV